VLDVEAPDVTTPDAASEGAAEPTSSATDAAPRPRAGRTNRELSMTSHSSERDGTFSLPDWSRGTPGVTREVLEARRVTLRPLPGRRSNPDEGGQVDDEEVACRQVVELVTDYLEGDLPEALRAAVERHLAECPHCVDDVEQMRTTAASLRGVSVESISPAARDQLIAAFRNLLPRR
jgi:hypothetical protein